MDLIDISDYDENKVIIKQCFICNEIVTKDWIYVPADDDDFHYPLNKNTYIIKDVEPFKFLYYVTCNNCLNSYLDALNCKKQGLNYIIKRELTGK
jgi:hypothetical protein